MWFLYYLGIGFLVTLVLFWRSDHSPLDESLFFVSILMWPITVLLVLAEVLLKGMKIFRKGGRK